MNKYNKRRDHNHITNTVDFQSKVDHPRMCIFSFACMAFFLLWPWPWADDLDIWTWPGISKVYQMKFLSRGFQKIERKQDRHTQRQTDPTERITSRTRGW